MNRIASLLIAGPGRGIGNGGQHLRRVRIYGEHLQSALAALCAERHDPVQLCGVGSVFWMYFSAERIDSHEAVTRYDGRRYARFAEQLLHEGVLVMPSGRWYVSAAHESSEMEATLDAVRRALDAPSVRK